MQPQEAANQISEEDVFPIKMSFLAVFPPTWENIKYMNPLCILSNQIIVPSDQGLSATLSDPLLGYARN